LSGCCLSHSHRSLPFYEADEVLFSSSENAYLGYPRLSGSVLTGLGFFEFDHFTRLAVNDHVAANFEASDVDGLAHWFASYPVRFNPRLRIPPKRLLAQTETSG